MVVTIDEVKKQCRIDACYHGDDEHLYRLMDTSVEHVAHLMGYKDMAEAFPDDNIPECVRHAVLMFVVHYYENAGVAAAVKLESVEQGALALIQFYVKYNKT